MRRDRLSLTCSLQENGTTVEISVNTLKAEAPGQAQRLGRFQVDLAGWPALRKLLHLLMPPGGLSFTGDSMVDQASRRLERQNG